MVRTLAKSLREHKKTTLLTVLFSFFEVVFEIFIPIQMSRLIDFGIDENNFTIVLKCATIILTFALCQLVSGFVAAKLAAKASSGFSANLREDMFENIQKFSFSNIDKFSTSSIVTRLTTDVLNIQNAYQMLIRLAIRSPIMLVFAVIASFRIDKEIATVFLFVIPLLAICLFFVFKMCHPVFKKVFKQYDHLNNVVQENVRGVRVVKTFCKEDFETKKFEGISKTLYDNFVKAERIVVLNMPIMQFFMYTTMIIISWLGARAIVASGNDAAIGLTTGNLTALMTYSMQILGSLMMFSMVCIMLVISRASAERISEILVEESDIVNGENPVMSVKDGEISFENVSFKYSKEASKKVIDNANFIINSGETIGIIGSTGSSKTSLVQLIPRLFDVIEGSIKVGGVDVRNYDIDVLRNEVAFVLQKNELFSGTITENLQWGKEDATLDEIKEACDLACASEFIEAMPKKYETYIEQGGSNVSGGQKQRLCIARALLKKPKILILDDSTSAVDTKTDAKIRKAFSQYIGDTTKIIIAQRISSIEDADKIIVMNDGKIDAIGNHDELMEGNEIYRDVYLSQQKGGKINE